MRAISFKHPATSDESVATHEFPGLKLRQRSNRLLTGSAGCMSLQAHHSSKVVRTVPCAARRQHPSSDLSQEATKCFAGRTQEGAPKPSTRRTEDCADHSPPVGETASRLAYIQKSEAHILHGRLLTAEHTRCETRLRRRGAEEQRSKVSVSASQPLGPSAARPNRPQHSPFRFHSSGSTGA